MCHKKQNNKQKKQQGLSRKSTQNPFLAIGKTKKYNYKQQIKKTENNTNVP